MEYFFEVITCKSEKISFKKNKSSDLWLVHNPEPHVEVYLNN
jgi:hypothetical protein